MKNTESAIKLNTKSTVPPFSCPRLDKTRHRPNAKPPVTGSSSCDLLGFGLRRKGWSPIFKRKYTDKPKPIVGSRVTMSGIFLGEKHIINSVLNARLHIKRRKYFLFINIKVVPLS